MTRLHLTFECQGVRCAATLDSAPGTTGLLMVSGGNEIRAGAFNGQARMAATIAAAGFPVFRFDRRGIGDSEGDNRDFRKSSKDIAAALLAFRAIAPQVQRVAGFGNCDAASALMLASGAVATLAAGAGPFGYAITAATLVVTYRSKVNPLVPMALGTLAYVALWGLGLA